MGLGPLPGSPRRGFQDPVQSFPRRFRVAFGLPGRAESELGRRQGGVDRQDGGENLDRFVRSAETGQRVAPSRPGVQVVRVDLRCPPEMAFSLLHLIPFGQHQRQVEARFPVLGIEGDRLPQAFLGGRFVSEVDESHGDVEEGLGIVRQGAERRFKRREGERRLTGAHRLGAAREDGPAAHIERLHRRVEGIGVADRDLPVPRQVIGRLFPASETSQGEPDPVVDGGALGLSVERLREVLERSLEAAGLELHPTETGKGRRVVGVEFENAAAFFCCLLGVVKVQHRVGAPRPCCEIVGRELENLVERRDGAFVVTVVRVGDRAVVGPAGVGRVERFSVAQCGLGDPPEVVDEVELTHVPEGGRELKAIRTRLLEQTVERIAGGAQLFLDGLLVVVGTRPVERKKLWLGVARSRCEHERGGKGSGDDPRGGGPVAPQAAGRRCRRHGVASAVAGEPSPRTRVT